MRILFLLGTLYVASPALAQGATGDDIADAETRARAAFNSGTVYYEAGDYEEALADFTAAYETSGRPELLWNIALCQEHLGRFEEAVSALQRFGAAGAPGHDVEAAQARLDALRARIEERGPLEPEEPAAVAPTEVDTTPHVAIVGFSLATLGVIGFAIAGPWLLVEDQSLAAECSPACSRDRVSTLETLGIVSDVSLGVALVGATVGVIGLLLAPSTPASPGPHAGLALHPWLSSSQGGMSLEGTF